MHFKTMLAHIVYLPDEIITCGAAASRFVLCIINTLPVTSLSACLVVAGQSYKMYQAQTAEDTS